MTTSFARPLTMSALGASLATAAAAAVLLLCGTMPLAAAGRTRPNYDALDHPGPARSRAPFALTPSQRALVKPGSEVQVDARVGAPTFVWAAPHPGNGTAAAFAPAPGGGPAREEQTEQAARRHLADYAEMYGLTPSDVAAAKRGAIHDTGRGAVIVAFQQRLGGIEVFRDEIRVVMDQGLDLVALSGYIPGAAAFGGAAARQAFTLSTPDAIAAAWNDSLGAAGPVLDAGDLARSGGRREGYDWFDLDARAAASFQQRLVEPARARQVLFHLPDSLEPAWYLELQIGSDGSVESDAYGYVVSAVDGRILFRRNLTASDSFSYRVWADTGSPFVPFDGPHGTSTTPHPTGLPDGTQPPFVAPNLLTLQNAPISTNDPWLPPGSTVTTGNNVEAYADIAAPDGFTAGDIRATTTSPGVFDRVYDTTLSPSASSNQRMAATTQLFFDVNFLHDWFYDAGFNEVSRNAQTNNFGRGGLQGDSIKAEAQDSSGTDNANMSTPADGGRPRMQMYVWTGVGHRALTVNAPPAIAGDYAVGTAQFGPATFSATNAVVLVNDGVATATDGCETPFANAGAVTGKIAFIDRGNCAFTVKVRNAQANGAVGVIIANQLNTGILAMGGTDATITIPSLLISLADGNTIRAQLGGVVGSTLTRDPALQRDGTIDNQIVAHEWGHYISNRLIGNASGLSNNQGGGMGEGWGDFTAVLMTVRPEDANAPSNPAWSGVYGITGYVAGGGTNGPLPNTGYYFGIRRYPYSADMTRNPLTFRHIANGTPMTPGPPLSFGADGSSNAEVHSTGEVWASMLWECYASLLRDTLGATPRLTFNQARDRMRSYLVAAYKTTPNAPTVTEARDAVLAAAAAADPADYVAFWRAFAKRGAGFGAVSPDRTSTANYPVTESFSPGVDLVFSGATLDDAVSYCDHDGVLDDTETGHLTITLRNAGTGSFSATTATITSANPHVSFPAGNAVSFPAVGPSGTTTAPVNVALSGSAGIQQLDFTIVFSDPGFTIPGAVTASFSQRGGYDDVANAAATDDVESASPRLTPQGNPSVTPAGGWRRQEVSAYDHLWHGPDTFATSDQFLVSPPLAVAPSGSFSLTFRHRWFFEFTTTPAVTNFDGGVIEISTNGGASWTDVGAAGGYNGTLATGGTNPLAGRAAFVQISPGYPAFVNTTVNLGTAFAGQTVLIRFRIGSDLNGDDPGWDIDDVAFSNLTGNPFNALVADRALCIDSDSDGFADRDDCSPFDAGTWSAPTEALDLDVGAAGGLSWSAPAQPGASALVYDVLQSAAASSFSAATCVESDGTDLMASDPSVPGDIFYYLVRSQNGCGSSLGADSAGTPRTGASCP